MCLTSKAYTVTMLGLMPDKTRESYDRMFGMLHDYCEEQELDTQWIGSTFMTDFEVAMRSSILMIFPSVQLLAFFSLLSKDGVPYEACWPADTE